MSIKPPRLQPGDRVRFVSPASPPEPEMVAFGARMLESWGLKVEIGAHVFDRHGHFLAGKVENRLADINEALRDPGVRAIFSTRGGKGSYRIAHALDFAAARSNPKPLIGYSDITILHLALWQQCAVLRDFMVLTLAGIKSITEITLPFTCGEQSWNRTH